ncbi:MAG: hypothetical protein KAT04_09745 [Methylococcales bacterium]|nr:hypothetical protein [Methylococcales bacterium]
MDENIDIDFVTKATCFVSQINNEDNLIALFTVSLSLLNERKNSTPDKHLNAIIEIAKKHNMLNDKA